MTVLPATPGRCATCGAGERCANYATCVEQGLTCGAPHPCGEQYRDRERLVHHCGLPCCHEEFTIRHECAGCGRVWA